MLFASLISHRSVHAEHVESLVCDDTEPSNTLYGNRDAYWHPIVTAICDATKD